MRWLVLTLGLAIGGVAGYALLTLEPGGEAPVRRASAAASPRASAPPEDHIDEASRAALRDILREADAEPVERSARP